MILYVNTYVNASIYPWPPWNRWKRTSEGPPKAHQNAWSKTAKKSWFLPAQFWQIFTRIWIKHREISIFFTRTFGSGIKIAPKLLQFSKKIPHQDARPIFTRTLSHFDSGILAPTTQFLPAQDVAFWKIFSIFTRTVDQAVWWAFGGLTSDHIVSLWLMYIV